MRLLRCPVLRWRIVVQRGDEGCCWLVMVVGLLGEIEEVDVFLDGKLESASHFGDIDVPCRTSCAHVDCTANSSSTAALQMEDMSTDFNRISLSRSVMAEPARRDQPPNFNLPSIPSKSRKRDLTVTLSDFRAKSQTTQSQKNNQNSFKHKFTSTNE